MLFKTDYRIRHFVANEFLTIKYNNGDHYKACLTGYHSIYKTAHGIWMGPWLSLLIVHVTTILPYSICKNIMQLEG